MAADREVNGGDFAADRERAVVDGVHPLEKGVFAWSKGQRGNDVVVEM
jgi:hypothetical protein